MLHPRLVTAASGYNLVWLQPFLVTPVSGYTVGRRERLQYFDFGIVADCRLDCGESSTKRYSHKIPLDNQHIQRMKISTCHAPIGTCKIPMHYQTKDSFGCPPPAYIHVWLHPCLGTFMSCYTRVWLQPCLGTAVPRYNRFWPQPYSGAFRSTLFYAIVFYCL